MKSNRMGVGRRTLIALAISCCMQVALAQSLETQRQYDLPAGRLVDALNVLSEQSGLQIVYDDRILNGKTAVPVRGVMTAKQALVILLREKGMEFEHVSERTVRVRLVVPPPTAPRPATRDTQQAPAAEQPINMAEVLVRGSRSLNADIQRSIDDPLPYVVFDRVEIERAGAINLNDFLLKRLSSNTSVTTASQSGEILGDRSGINLRGLGEGQTLILVDGRRLSVVSGGFSPGQPNLNGIPLAAVERIEVLPTTASAIYGGSATGGVINVVLRRGYEGGEVAFSHDNSFDTDSSINRIDLAYGFSSRNGRTSVMLNGSRTETNFLLNRDRNFFTRGMEHILATNPDYFGFTTPRPSTTPNLRSSTGVDLVLDNGTPLNSPITYVPAGYLGPASDGAAALVANAGRHNTEPSMTGGIRGGNGSFGAAPRTESLAASVRHGFTDWLDGFLDLSHNQTRSRTPDGVTANFSLGANDPRNPFLQPIQVVLPTDAYNANSEQSNRTDRASAGLIARLPGEWAASLDFTWSRSSLAYNLRPGAINVTGLLASGFNPLIDHYNLGTLDFGASAPQPLGALGLPVTAYSYNPTLRLGGPLWELPGGPVTASFLLEQQKSNFSRGVLWSSPGTPGEVQSVFPPRSQDVRSFYVELGVPLFGAANARPGMQALDLQLALRHDDYRSVSGNRVLWFPSATPEPPPFELVENGSAETTGLVGLKYTPFAGLSLRASHGTGFVPPDVTQLGAPNRSDVYYSQTPDPRRGNSASALPAVYVSGNNPNLGPEQSETTSVGLIVEPVFLPGFRASLDYMRLEKTENITSISLAQLLQYEAQFPERIQRGPRLPDDPAGWAGPITYIDISSVNAALARLDNLDLQLKYGLDLDNGSRLEFWGNGTWTLKAEQQLLPGLAPTNQRGIAAAGGNSLPLHFRGFYGLDFERGGWGLSWTVRHYSSYLIANPALASNAPILAAQGNGGRVPRQILHDVSLRWRSLSSGESGALASLARNLEVNAGIRNVFNTEPEVDLSSTYTFYSYLADARLRTYYVQLKYLF